MSALTKVLCRKGVTPARQFITGVTELEDDVLEAATGGLASAGCTNGGEVCHASREPCRSDIPSVVGLSGAADAQITIVPDTTRRLSVDGPSSPSQP